MAADFCDRIRTARRGPERWLRAFIARKEGVAATEFALIAPVMVVAIVSTLDIGRLVTEKMRVDAALRSATEVAITTGNQAHVSTILSELDAISATPITRELKDRSARIYCTCPETPDTEVGCTSTCPAGAPSVYASLSMTQQTSSLLLPDFSFTSSTLVQLR